MYADIEISQIVFVWDCANTRHTISSSASATVEGDVDLRLSHEAFCLFHYSLWQRHLGSDETGPAVSDVSISVFGAMKVVTSVRPSFPKALVMTADVLRGSESGRIADVGAGLDK